MTTLALQNLARNTENTKNIIHELTKERAWKKTQIAELCNVSSGQVTFWSKGENTPSPEAFGILLSLLNRKLPSEKVCLLEVCDSKRLQFPDEWYSSFLLSEVKREIKSFNQSCKNIYETMQVPTTKEEAIEILTQRYAEYIDCKIDAEIKNFNHKSQINETGPFALLISDKPPRVIFNKACLSSAETLLHKFEEKLNAAKGDLLKSNDHLEEQIEKLKRYISETVNQISHYEKVNHTLNEQLQSRLERYYQDYLNANAPETFSSLNYEYTDLLMIANYVNQTMAASRYGNEENPFDLKEMSRYQWYFDKGREHEFSRRLTISHSELERFINKAEEMYETYRQFVHDKRQRYDDIAEKVKSRYQYNPLNFNAGYNNDEFELLISEGCFKVTDEINMSTVAARLLADKSLSVKLSISDDDMATLGSTEVLALWLEENLIVDIVTKPTQVCGEIIFESNEVSGDVEQLTIYRTITNSLVYMRKVNLQGESQYLLSTALSAAELLEELRTVVGMPLVEKKVKQQLLQLGYMFEGVAFIC